MSASSSPPRSAERSVTAPPSRTGTAEPTASGGRRLWALLWRAPDPDLVHAGVRGEWTIASLRVLLVLLILYFPLSQYLGSPTYDGRTALWFGVAALAEALVLYSASRRSWGRGWIGFFSGALDVTLVSMALMLFLLLDRPLEAVSDLVIFPIYMLAIGATSLRFDWRVSLLTGAAAIVQYAGIVAWAHAQWQYDGIAFGTFGWTEQIGRFALLAMATALALVLVVRAHEQRTLSNRDRLTQLANRGFFDESIGRIGALASRTDDVVSIAMLDIDHFKRFNDTYGHLGGDEALRVVAGVLRSAFRTTDLVARYGGEEFAGIFPAMAKADAIRRLEYLRERVESLEIPLDERRRARVTLSIGVAEWPTEGTDLVEILALADERLYAAKEAGRNRVVAGAPKARPAVAERVAASQNST